LDFIAGIPSRDSSYGRWLMDRAPNPISILGEERPPPERWIQQIWNHQRLRREDLVTRDGRRVRVLHPGFWNHQSGPDFRQAVIQIGDASPRVGDVELDLRTSGWRAHRHDINPGYSHVILRIVWEAPETDRGSDVLPILVLRPVLELPLPELLPWIESDLAQGLSQWALGRCHLPLKDLPRGVLNDVIRQAAAHRLRQKAQRIALRARDAGWKQALWEGLFGALGYRHNVWPMRCVAECLRERWGNVVNWPTMESPLHWEARLLGISGFLPDHLPDSDRQRDRVRSLWDNWWRERDDWLGRCLPRQAWQLGGLRPANHPQRRLATAAFWLARPDFAYRLEGWLVDASPGRVAVESMREILQVPEDPFWMEHWTLHGQHMRKKQPLLGLPRSTDVVMNVVLPWLWARCASGAEEGLQARAEAHYFGWPSGEPNSRLKFTCQRLFAGLSPRVGRQGAAWQQGLLQIQQDFCARTDALCAECDFPALIRSLGPDDPGSAPTET
jgi:hypothetical protein